MSPNQSKKTNSADHVDIPEFLRRQAENCLRIARSCFDLTSAERLRLMAAELNAKAAEMDSRTTQDRWPRASSGTLPR